MAQEKGPGSWLTALPLQAKHLLFGSIKFYSLWFQIFHQLNSSKEVENFHIHDISGRIKMNTMNSCTKARQLINNLKGCQYAGKLFSQGFPTWGPP